jgi:hypothetical protein
VAGGYDAAYLTVRRRKSYKSFPNGKMSLLFRKGNCIINYGILCVERGKTQGNLR